MRRNLLFLFLAAPCLILAQAGSVELKTAPNTSIGTFNTIAAAYAAIPASITQAYIIEMGATYNGAEEANTVTLNVRSGSSSTNTITLRPAAGVASVTLSKSGAAAVILLDDADYIIIDGRPGGTGNNRAFTVANTSTAANANTIQLTNGATNNVIRYCVISNGTVSNAGRNVFFGTSPSNVSGNSDNLVEFCTVNSGRYSINNNGTAANPNRRNRIYGCEINTVRFVGVWVQANCGKTYIDSCNIFCTSNTGDTPYGVLGDGITDSLVITRNKIYDLFGATSGSVRGINVRSVTGTNYTVIENNFISLGGPAAPNSSSTNLMGIEISITATFAANIFINNNTVRIMGTLTSGGSSGSVVSTCLNFASSASNAGNNLNVYNNIFINERSGGASGVQHLAMSVIPTTGTRNFNYNTFNSSTGNLVRLGSTVYTNITDYQTAMGPVNETQANSTAVQVVSETDLHLAGTSIGNSSLKGTPLATVVVDIDNQVRSATEPYRGGDEYSPAIPLRFISINARRDAADAIISWITAEEVNNSRFDIERSVDGRQFVVAGSVPARATPSVLNEYRFTDRSIFNSLPSGQLYYRVKQIDKDGRFNYSPIVSLKAAGNDVTASVYPNPVKNNLVLLVSSPVAMQATMRITNAAGASILTRKAALAQGSNSLTYTETAVLAKGYYFISIEAAELKKVIPFVKE